MKNLLSILLVLLMLALPAEANLTATSLTVGTVSFTPTTVSDNFDTGSTTNWSQGLTDAMVFANNRLERNASLTSAIYWKTTTNAFAAKQFSKIQVQAGPDSTHVHGAGVRMSGTTTTFNGYVLTTAGTTNLIIRYDNGTPTTIKTCAAATVALNEYITIRVSGTTISVYRGVDATTGAETLIDSVVDATYSTGQPGAYAASGSGDVAILDNWTGGEY